MVNNGVENFLSEAVEKSKILEALEDTEMTAWHYTGKKRTANVSIERSPVSGNSADFWTKNVPRNWHKKIQDMSPKIFVKGRMENLSSEDSKKVMRSLSEIPKASDYVNILNLYDNASGITAMWQNPGWGEVFRNFLSTKTPASELHRYIDNLAQRCDVTEYQVISGESERTKKNGVLIETEDSDLLKLFREFAEDKNAKMKKLQFGESITNDKIELNYETAKKLVFPTPLKKISYANVNCYTISDNFCSKFTDIDAGAVYVRDGDLKITARTPERMVELASRFF